MAEEPAESRGSGRLLYAALVLTGILLVACWLQRLASDLNWDEAHSFRAYARHPLTAIALYLEPNNHPLESLFRSLFYGVLGLDRPPLYRLPGLVLLVVWFGALIGVLRSLARRGEWLAVAVLALGLAFSESTQVQVLQLRGYFPSMILVLLMLGRVLRENGPPAPDSRPVLAYAVLTALLLFTVPSNLLLLPALWGALWVARRDSPGRAAALVLGSAGLTILLYLPILAGWVLGINRLDRFPAEEPVGVAAGALDGVVELFSRATPVGIPWWALAGAAGLLALLAGIRSRGRSGVRIGLTILAGLLVINALFSALFTAPIRIKSPMVPALWFALALLAEGAVRGLSARGRRRTALILATLSLLLVPRIFRALEPERTVTGIVDTLEATLDPARRFVLIGADTADLQFYLGERFGEERLIRSRDGIDETFSGRFLSPVGEEASWKRTLRERFFPELERPPLDPRRVETLVLITEVDLNPGDSLWTHSRLDSLAASLEPAGVLEVPPYHIVIRERRN